MFVVHDLFPLVVAEGRVAVGGGVIVEADEGQGAHGAGVALPFLAQHGEHLFAAVEGAEGSFLDQRLGEVARVVDRAWRQRLAAAASAVGELEAEEEALFAGDGIALDVLEARHTVGHLGDGGVLGELGLVALDVVALDILLQLGQVHPGGIQATAKLHQEEAGALLQVQQIGLLHRRGGAEQAALVTGFLQVGIVQLAVAVHVVPVAVGVAQRHPADLFHLADLHQVLAHHGAPGLVVVQGDHPGDQLALVGLDDLPGEVVAADGGDGLVAGQV
ncbi:hypothetical protein D3C81_1234290 [compost metagenome]